MIVFRFILLFVILAAGLAGCSKKNPVNTTGNSSTEPVSAKIVGPVQKIPGMGDLWLSTWASDDNLYMSWGDGTGLGTCYPIPANTPNPDSALTVSSCIPETVVFCEDFCGVFPCDGVTPYSPCVLTQAGVFRLKGAVGDFTGGGGEDVRGIHIPTGIPQFEYGFDPTTRRGDKPSSLLFYNGVLYWHGHQFMTPPRYGYIAYSNDFGKTWTEVPNSPWTGASNFRVLMLINMGKNYELNRDGYVYGLGIHGELSTLAKQSVYLARVPRDSIASYASYRYFTGNDENGAPRWSADQFAAVALDRLNAIALGAAIYHPGVKKYLFLTVAGEAANPALTLFAADEPWGPWKTVQRFDGEIYIAGIISKDTGSNSFYFTGAGGAGMGNTYQLNIAKIEMRIQ